MRNWTKTVVPAGPTPSEYTATLALHYFFIMSLTELIGNFLYFLSLGNNNFTSSTAPPVFRPHIAASEYPGDHTITIHYGQPPTGRILYYTTLFPGNMLCRMCECVFWCWLICCWFISVAICVLYSGSHIVCLNESSVWTLLTLYIDGICSTLMSRPIEGNSLDRYTLRWKPAKFDVLHSKLRT